MASRSIHDLQGIMVPRVEAWLASCKASGLDVLVYCTVRDLKEQAALYAQGRSKPGKIVTYAKPSLSAHNHGLALDAVPMLNGKPQWQAPSREWLKFVQLAEAAGLSSASKWSRFKEWPHLEMPNWQDLVNGPMEAA